jgi:hydroxyacyl-ACP dehydratase HTD2-like protein with hotdog domain
MSACYTTQNYILYLNELTPSVSMLYSYKEINMYKPKFLSWCTSYEEEVEEFRELILGEPADVKLLKSEYYQLTGKQFRRKKGE